MPSKEVSLYIDNREVWKQHLMERMELFKSKMLLAFELTPKAGQNSASFQGEVYDRLLTEILKVTRKGDLALMRQIKLKKLKMTKKEIANILKREQKEKKRMIKEEKRLEKIKLRESRKVSKRKDSEKFRFADERKLKK